MPSVRERDMAALSLFADEMKAAREQRGWSQADLADKIPFSLSTISMVEALHRVPTRGLAVHLDKAFGTPGTFTRLEARLRDLPFPAPSGRSLPTRPRPPRCTYSSTAWFRGCSRRPPTPVLCWPPAEHHRGRDRQPRGRTAGPTGSPDPRRSARAAAVGTDRRGRPVSPGGPGSGHARSAHLPGGDVAATQHRHSGRAIQRGRSYRAARAWVGRCFAEGAFSCRECPFGVPGRFPEDGRGTRGVGWRSRKRSLGGCPNGHRTGARAAAGRT